MIIPQERFLDLIKGTVIYGLEGGIKGSRFPNLISYLEMEGEDVDCDSVRKIRAEFDLARKEINDKTPIGVYENGQFVPVEAVSGMARSANPDAPLFLRSAGIRIDFPAREKLEKILEDSIDMCDEAIRRQCGFGRYSRPSV